jgi:uncharacterized membrane protein
MFILIIFLSSNLFAKHYSIDNYNIDYRINNDATVDVNEELAYTLSGCYTELYIQKPKDLNITNYSGVCLDKDDCKFKFEDSDFSESGGQELILKSDFCDEKVKIKFSYTVNNVLFELKNGYQFYYKLYGDKTEVPTNAYLNLEIPVDFNNTNYFMHTLYDDYDLNVFSNKLIFSKKLDDYELVEINLIFPKTNILDGNNIFLENSVFDKSKIDKTRTQVEKDTTIFSIKKFIFSLIPIIYFILALSPLWISILIFLLFTKKKKGKSLRYFNSYERDLPSEHDPIEAHYFLKGGFPKNWISIVLLYLVWKNYFTIVKGDKDISFVKTSKKFDIKDFPYKNNLFSNLCQSVYDRLVKLVKSSKNFKISLKFLKKKISKYNNSLAYDFSSIERKYKEFYKLNFKSGKYLNTTNTLLIIKFNFFLIPILGFILLYYDTIGNFLAIRNCLIVFVYYFLAIILSIFIHVQISKKYGLESFFGRWSDEGRLLNLKWSNFNKYIQDFSLIKDYPPESVVIWDYYLIYATSFGSAKKCVKILSKDLNVQLMLDYDSISIMYAISIRTSSIGSSSGGSSGGSSSGGSGGGGAGAR